MKFKFTHQCHNVCYCELSCVRLDATKMKWNNIEEMNRLTRITLTIEYVYFLRITILFIWPCKYSMKNDATERNEQREKKEKQNERARVVYYESICAGSKTTTKIMINYFIYWSFSFFFWSFSFSIHK